MAAVTTQAATPIGGRPREPVLGQEPADRVAEPGEQHREPAEQLVARAAEVDAEQQPDAGDAERDPDQSREPSERSSWSTQIASSAVNSGAEVTRIPASEEEISCSPAAISRNGPATWIAPRTATRSRSAPEATRARRARRRARAGPTAPSAIRRKATIPGEKSRMPILISM